MRDVLDVVNRHVDPPRAYTSVMSLLNVMTDKGLLRRSPQGRAFLYEPVSPREQTLRSLLGETLERVYSGSASLLVAAPARPVAPVGRTSSTRSARCSTHTRTDGPRRRRKEGPDAGDRGRSIRRADRPLVWLALIHSLWIGLLVAAAAALITQSAPRVSHRARHAILVVAMLLAALGPVAMTAWQYLGPAREDGPLARGSAASSSFGPAGIARGVGPGGRLRGR